MARKDVKIKKLFGELSETETNSVPKTQETDDLLPPPETEESIQALSDEKESQKSYRDRVDAVHGKPTTVRLRPETIQRVNLATKKLRVKKGEFYNFAINYFLDQLEADPTILPVTPAKYDIDSSL